MKSEGGGGGGEGIFSLHDFFYPLLVQDFFFRVKPSAGIFFFKQILICLAFTNFTKNGVLHRFNTSEYG